MNNFCGGSGFAGLGSTRYTSTIPLPSNSPLRLLPCKQCYLRLPEANKMTFSIMVYTGRLCPKGVPFSGSLVEVYERVGKSVIWFRKNNNIKSTYTAALCTLHDIHTVIKNKNEKYNLNKD